MISHYGQNSASGGGPATRYWEGAFTKSIDYAAGYNASGIVEGYNFAGGTAQSVVNSSQRTLTDVEVSVNDAQYQAAVRFNVDLDGSNVDTAEVVVLVELIWEKFRTPPTIST